MGVADSSAVLYMWEVCDGRLRTRRSVRLWEFARIAQRPLDQHWVARRRFVDRLLTHSQRLNHRERRST